MYKLAWFMRGGVDSKNLFTDTDIEDIQILQNIVKENIEFTKASKMPLI